MWMPRVLSAILALLCGSVAALAQTPSHAAWQAYRAGQAALGREDFKLAEQQFRSAIQEERRFALAYYGLGTTMASTRRYQEAADAFTQAIAMHREWFAQRPAEAMKLDQQRDEEIRELRDSIQALLSGRVKFSGPTTVILLEQRIERLEREKAGEKTLPAEVPVPAEFYVALGGAHHHLGHAEEARAAYEEALKLDPARGEAHNNLAVLALGRDDKEGAREHARQAEAAGFRVNPDLKREVGLEVKKSAEMTIEHEPLTCAAVGVSPVIQARVSGPEAPAQVRVRFSSATASYWYSVRMKAEGDGFVARLPRPKAGLESFSYTIDATDNAAASARTPPVKVPIVASAAACPQPAVPPVREALVVEIPASAPSRPPVPDGFSADAVRGVGGTKIGITNLPAKLGAMVGVAAAAGVAAAGRDRLYVEDKSPVSPVAPTAVELVSVDPPPGSTLVSPSQQVRATFRVTLGRAAQRVLLVVRLRNGPAGVGCIEIVGVTGPQAAGVSFELAAVGPADASRFCPATFEVGAFGVEVQADDEIVVFDRAFPAQYSVVRAPGS